MGKKNPRQPVAVVAGSFFCTFLLLIWLLSGSSEDPRSFCKPHKRTWRDFSEDELARIELARADARSNNVTRIAGINYQKVCPACGKPNALQIDFCTACGFNLFEEDVQRMPDNIFIDIIEDRQQRVHKWHYRDDDYIVFDDKFGTSDNHLDIIPTKLIEDISQLTTEHIPMLERMYELGMETLRNRCRDNANVPIQLYTEANLESYATAGYNYPVSVKQLHLHVVLPPVYHTRVLTVGRWHSHAKVLRDLREHGRVIPYQEQPNVPEGQAVYDRMMRLHAEVSTRLIDC
eukprot:TRINITY_DN18555_c0_g1_i1.p1 TRINITY_DN18555_c0_g1~~TRINITY_DN18555_c0_g1_i1.p1  ORF type:complete len:290 (+),score=34.48 TRINITY_DN18555_c0_g1_i1:14-883(+)